MNVLSSSLISLFGKKRILFGSAPPEGVRRGRSLFSYDRERAGFIRRGVQRMKRAHEALDDLLGNRVFKLFLNRTAEVPRAVGHGIGLF